MNKISGVLLALLVAAGSLYSQPYTAGFMSLELKDSSRIYKPNSVVDHSLHFRPMDVDIWYPSVEKGKDPLKFEDLFRLFEQRAINYQDNEDYSGITEELALLYVVEMGAGTEGDKLLDITTNSYREVKPAIDGQPVILYLAGFNGMGYENYPLLEKLAQQGFVVVSIWSVGRYPGDMTNQKEDMMEQVYDAEFALNYLSKNLLKNAQTNSPGIIGCSWGGMSAAVFIERQQSNVQAFLSLDGTETHYFGNEDQNDEYIREIHKTHLRDLTGQNAPYLYLESDDKLDEFDPTGEFHYFKNLTSEKYYLRFINSAHVDLTCLPSILEASDESVEIYHDIESIGVSFFNYAFEEKNSFKTDWQNLSAAKNTLTTPFVTGPKSLLTIDGSIREKNSNQPLPYVNIGILNKDKGTVSNTSGRFSLQISELNEDDTLRISSIGFKPQTIPIKTLKNAEEILIKLEEQVDELEEVVITTKAYKEKVLGNKTESKFIGTGFGYDQLGAEMGIKLNIKNNPTFVDSFSFYVTHNRLSAASVFRLNIYSAESKKPGLNLLKENILVTINPKETGKFTIDLKEKNIVLRDDVYITLEWVEIDGENNKGEAIFFPIGFFNSGTLYKSTSQAKFKKHSGMGVGFTLDVRY